MATFLHAPLLWGLLLVGVPVLIHLINMLRHRRVQWAAMEFLLASQKKNRTWVLLKQLLLLATRMAVVAALVLLVAQPRLRGQWAEWFGGTTHHIVLLDDSFSMSDRWGDTSAFEQAKGVVERIARDAGREGAQKFTLLRFSQAGRLLRGTQPDLLGENIDAEFGDRLHDLVAPMKPSQSAADATAALDAVDQLLEDSQGEQRVVYLVSDFRARQWDDPSAAHKHLTDWQAAGTQLYFINCVDGARPNLAITELAAGAGTRAAGVPLFMEVSVANYGDSPVKDVPVLVEADGQAQPAVTIPSIPPRRTVKERFPVRFVTGGEHRITARLEADAVEADNFRYAVIDIPLTLPVLLVDGDPEAQDARYLNAVFAPGGPVPTGLSPRIEGPRYLNSNPLDPFRAIYLLNVDRLEKSAIAALEKYVQDGGGVSIFLGPRSQPEFINKELYREGQGIFPLPLERPAELYVDHLEKAPDLEVTRHPVFKIFEGEKNGFLPLVRVNRYVSVPKTWQPDANGSVQVLARLRNGAPLAVERKVGRGRVVAFLTTAAPVWNNWARENPSFVVAMLELQSYLSQQVAAEAPHVVGAPLELKLDPSRYEPQVRFTTPDAAPLATTEAVLEPSGQLRATLPNTDLCGIYEARLTQKDGKEELRRWAVNVEPEEGDLKTTSAADLAARLPELKYHYDTAATFQYDEEERTGTNLALPLLYLLIFLLVGEMILAWSASYHAPSLKPGAAAGGVR